MSGQRNQSLETSPVGGWQGTLWSRVPSVLHSCPEGLYLLARMSSF